MMETSARRPRRSDLAAARCIAGCKNTAWNETPPVRTSHPASGAGGGTTRLANRIDSSLEWHLFLPDRLDSDVFYRELVAGFRDFSAPSCCLLLANALQSPLRDARRGFFLPRARCALRRRT